MSALQRLPFTVIGGFLGAGKTTLLNHWLRHAEGQRLAVLVNDFGALNIDAGLIDHRAADTIALTNGCVCCQVGDDLSRALWQITDEASRFDAVVVEASGVADPWRIAQLGRGDPGLSLEGVVVLVNAGALLGQACDARLADTLTRQLRGADLIVLNHVDTADHATLQGVHSWVATHAPHTPRLATRHAAVPLPLLNSLALPRLQLAQSDERVKSGSGHESGAAVGTHAAVHQAAGTDTAECSSDGATDEVASDATALSHWLARDWHEGVRFEAWSARPQNVFDEEALRDWLRAPPPGLLRLKGWLRGAERGWLEIQFSGRHGSLRRASTPLAQAQLVAIGLQGQLPRAALSAAFERTGAI